MIASRRKIVELFKEMKGKYGKAMDGSKYREELMKDLALFDGLIALGNPDMEVH